MKSWNTVNLLFFVGMITDQPRFKKTKNGTLITEARIRVDERFGKTNSKKQDIYLDVIAFDKNALALNVVARKGAVVFLECHATNIPGIDKVTGVDIIEIKIVADKFQVLKQAPKDPDYTPLFNSTVVHEITKLYGKQTLEENIYELLEAIEPSKYGVSLDDDEELYDHEVKIFEDEDEEDDEAEEETEDEE